MGSEAVRAIALQILALVEKAEQETGGRVRAIEFDQSPGDVGTREVHVLIDYSR